ncbi:MAG: O-antigen ligase family protein [Bryobacteraceae bacterium]|jgi:O-antigen ligase
MQASDTPLQRAALCCAIGSAGSIAASIAISQILLGASLALVILLVATRQASLRLPSGWQFLAFFAVWTTLSWLVNGHLFEGRFQIRKFYVLLIVVVIATTFRGLRDARWVVSIWLGLGALSALWGLGQFWRKWDLARRAGSDFYLSYVSARITGFNSHWMTFSEILMFTLLAGVAIILWDRAVPAKWRWAAGVAVLLCGLAIVLAMTRGVWIAAAAGLLYLLWAWRRWTVLALPVVAVLAFAIGPPGLRERMISIVHPHGDADSNMHRYVTFRTGVEMIKSHPLLGLGPDMIGPDFQQYVPADIPRPLPAGFYGHLHNVYVQFSAERGIPAMLAMIGFLVWNLWLWLRRLAQQAASAETTAASAWLLRAGVAMLIGVLVIGLFEHCLGSSVVLALTLSTVACVDSACREVVHV